jgi:cytochrome c553
MKYRDMFPLVVLWLPTLTQAVVLEEQIRRYQGKGAGPFTAEQGAIAWKREVRHGKSGKLRACQNCHGEDLTRPGRHVKTGKTIKPMAVSVNPQRLSDGKKIEKWFKRNCKWTWGRECTAQEKGDILLYLKQF